MSDMVQASLATPSKGLEVDQCAHCAEPLDRGPVVWRMLDGVLRPYCCHGCAFIAEQLRTVPVADRSAVASDPLDMPMDERRVVLQVHGMVCTACALLIETRLRQLPGVCDAQVAFATQRVEVRFDAAKISTDTLINTIDQWGYATQRSPAQIQFSRRVELARVLIAWLAMAQVMMLAMPEYLAAPGEMATDIAQLLRWSQCLLTLPVMFFCALPLMRAARNQIRARAVGMDVPIVLGVWVAWGASIWGTFQENGAVYFDTVTMFVALVLGSRWLQAHALEKARSVLDTVRGVFEQKARRLLNGHARSKSDVAQSAPEYEVVPAHSLMAGDHVHVLPGEVFPADGIVHEGVGTVSQAWLIGEARPMPVQVGAGILAGSVNLESPVTVQVTRSGERTALAALSRLADRSMHDRPRVIELANRVARIFLWLVFVLVIATVAFWLWADASRALPNALAVIIVTCPCALSLAAPAVWTAAQSVLARRGVWVTRDAAIESLAHVDVLALDKTGTLTTQSPTLMSVVPLAHMDLTGVQRIAAGLASISTHPYARAVFDNARVLSLEPPPLEAARVIAGQGVEAFIEGAQYRLGRVEFSAALCGRMQRSDRQALRALVDQAATGMLLLADTSGPLALFVVGESVREGASELIDDARRLGLSIWLLSGDRQAAVQEVAARVGLGVNPPGHEAQVHSELRPEDKCARMAQLQAQGKRVAMVGDGINDAPVLAQADVSFALGSDLGGTALAQMRADMIVLNANLRVLSDAVRLARRAMYLVRYNFLWAVGYNVTVLPLAMAGWLSPVLAAVGMAASSLLVVGNALRLLREQ